MLTKVWVTCGACVFAACARPVLPVTVPPQPAPIASSVESPADPSADVGPLPSFSESEPSYEFADVDRKRNLVSAFDKVDSISCDGTAFSKYFGQTKKNKADAVSEFNALRSMHGVCTVKSSTIEGFDRSFDLECERGGNLSLTLEIEKKNSNQVVKYAFRGAPDGACPVR